jgi:type I restriction enzyme M protein
VVSFLGAYNFIDECHQDLNREQGKVLKLNTVYGNGIVAGTIRLALMNLCLHNIGDIDHAGGRTSTENSISVQMR